MTDLTPEQRFGRRLRERREALCWSQSLLADLLHQQAGIKLDPTAITRIEGGNRGVSLNEAVALASLIDSNWPVEPAGKWAVVLDEARGQYAYGPFTDELVPLAMRFADFLKEEVDPASIVPLDEIVDMPLKLPLAEVLNWRDAVKPLLTWREGVTR